MTDDAGAPPARITQANGGAQEGPSMTSVEIADTALQDAGAGQRVRAGRSSRVVARDTTEPETVELARQAGEGCDESFALLVGRFGGSIFSYLRHLTGRHHDAEDLTQETFLKAYRGLRRDPPPRSFRAWIFTIARRTALNHFRSARPTEELRPESLLDHDDPAALTAEQDERGSVWRVARRLKPRQYEVLWLRYAEGLSIEETAQVTKLGRIHVRVLLHRARLQLAQHLRRRDSLPDPPHPARHSSRRTP